MAYKPKFRSKLGFYQRASQRGDGKTIYLFKSVKNLPAKERLYTIAYNLSSAAAFVPFSTGQFLAAPYFIGEAWNTVSALTKGARGDMKALLGRGRFLTGASTLNKYGAKAFDAITPNTGIGFVDRYASIAVGQQKAAFLSSVRNLGSKEKLEVISELVANGTILDSEILQQAAGKKARGKNLGIKTGIFRKWQIQTYYNAFKNAPDPWKNSPFKSARAARRAQQIRSKRKFHNTLTGFKNPDAQDHEYLSQLMNQVDDMQSDVVYYQSITRYLAADAMLVHKDRGRANPYEALRQKQERDMRKEYRDIMGMEYLSNGAFLREYELRGLQDTSLKSYSVYDSGMTVERAQKTYGLDVDSKGHISTSSSRNAQQATTDAFIASGFFMSDKQIAKESTKTTAPGGKKIDKDGDYFANIASSIKTNPEVAKIFNEFASSVGVNMKAGANMSEVIADLMTIFHTIQGDASFRNQEFKLRSLQLHVGIMASKLHGAGYSQMGDKFISLFGGEDAYHTGGKGNNMFTLKTHEAFSGVDTNIIRAKGDAIELVLAMNSHAFYKKYRDSLVYGRNVDAQDLGPVHEGLNHNPSQFKSSAKQVNLNSLTQKEREELVKAFVADYNFDWEKPQSQIGSKVDNPFRGKGSKLDIWQGYADKDREHLLPTDTFSSTARSRKQLQKELIDLVERGIPPAALVDYARRHYAQHSLARLREISKKHKTRKKVDILLNEDIFLDDIERPSRSKYGNKSTSLRKHDNFLPTQRQIQEAIHMLDMEKKGKSENDRSEYLFRYIVEFGTANAGDNHANAIRDALEIEFGGPATDRHKRLQNRTDNYMYIPSYFMQLSATTAAARLGIFDKGAQVMSTAPEMGIKQLSKVTMHKTPDGKSAAPQGAFNNLRKNYRQKKADLYQGHRRVQQLFKDMDKAVKGTGRTNWNQDSVGGRAMRTAHARNLKLFRQGGGFGEIVHDDIITNAREFDYIKSGIFGTDTFKDRSTGGTGPAIFNINKLGYRKRTGLNVPLLDTISGTYAYGIAHRTGFKNPKNNIVYNHASGAFERNTIGIDGHGIQVSMEGTENKKYGKHVFSSIPDAPEAYSKGIKGIVTDAKMDIRVGRNKTQRWMASMVLVDHALGLPEKSKNSLPMLNIFTDPVMGIGEFFGAIDKNGLSTSWGDNFSKMISTNKGHSLVQKFNRVFLGNEFYNTMIDQFYHQGMNGTILRELVAIDRSLSNRYEKLVKKKIGAVVRRLQNQFGSMMNWQSADAFFSNESNFRVMLMEMATRINSAKMNFAAEMDMLRDYMFNGISKKSILKEKAKIQARLAKQEMGAEALDSKLHSQTYSDMRDLEWMDDAVVTHNSDEGNPMVLVLTTGERMDLEDYAASKGEKFTRLRKVYTKQYNLDPYTGEQKKGGPKFNIHGSWVADNSREDILKLLGATDMDQISFEPPMGLDANSARSVHASKVARAMEMDVNTDFSYEEAMKAQGFGPKKSYEEAGELAAAQDWTTSDELKEVSKSFKEIQDMPDVIANIEAVANSGADRAYMMAALLEHYHLLLRKGTAQHIAKEKVRGGVIVVSKYFDKAKHNDFTYESLEKFQMNTAKLRNKMLDVADDIMMGASVGRIAADFVYATNKEIMHTAFASGAGVMGHGLRWKTLLTMSMHFKDKTMRRDFFRFAYADYVKKGKKMEGDATEYMTAIRNMYAEIGPPTLDYNRIGNWSLADWNKFNYYVSQIITSGGLTAVALTFPFLGTGIPQMIGPKGKRIIDLPSYITETNLQDAQYIMKKYEKVKRRDFLTIHQGKTLIDIKWIKNRKMYNLNFRRKRN